MTLNGQNVTFAEKFFNGAHQKNFNEDRPILSTAKCRPMIVVSRNMRYLWICAWVPRGGGVNCQTTISVHACIHACADIIGNSTDMNVVKAGVITTIRH